MAPVALQPAYYPVVLLAVLVIAVFVRRWPRVLRARRTLDAMRRKYGE
jgi:hypothetical protein